jgi:hypothetical protein
MIHQRNQTWSDTPVVIDAANVAGSAVLPGCGKFCWDRLDLVRQAWRNQVDPEVTFVMVMDTGPSNQLGASCKRKYRDERRAGEVVEVDFGDPEILRIAEETDAAVITGDFYKDQRREHPWIDGNRTQFFRWEVENGVVVIVGRDMGIPSDFSKTRAEERAELKGMGADVANPEVERALRRVYRCDTDTCWLHKYDPGHYTGVPDVRDPRRPLCSVCREPLTVLGESPRLVQVKLADASRTKLERRTLSPGDSLVIGRNTSDELVSRVLAADVGLVSRQHARLDWDGSQLTLTDLNSKNGTTVRRWAGKQRGYDSAVRITGTVSLGPRDEACLAGALLITRSARGFLLEADDKKAPSPVSSPPTVAQNARGI